MANRQQCDYSPPLLSCVCVLVFRYVQVHVLTCKSQRKTLGAIPWPGTCQPESPRNLLVSSVPGMGLSMHHHV